MGPSITRSLFGARSGGTLTVVFSSVETEREREEWDVGTLEVRDSGPSGCLKKG